jgi:hypothetical protein
VGKRATSVAPANTILISLNLSEFVVASKRAQKRKAEAKEAQGEKAYKAIAEEQRALQSLCDAAYTVNDLPRVQRTVS